ncbi:MuDR family transposase [Artemisia annua]|uniref:MuDR family transposase n=1 Tax=Artemisia annua TaxID=35608 RepID=A0A2U1NKX3_ARTAN|nr:MuDR family transposase [Artemisia annua]
MIAIIVHVIFYTYLCLKILETFINMVPKFVTLLCYWDGAICDGPEGVFYNKPPSKAIKVQCGIRYNQLINQIHSAIPIDKQQHHIKVICRYPTVAGKVMKYISLHINDNNDVEIMFDVLTRHKKLSNIDLYIVVEDIEQRHEEMAPNNCITQNSILVDEERNNDVRHINVVEDMIRGENFNKISNFAVVNNEMCNEIDITNEVDVEDTLEEGHEEEAEPLDNYQVSSNFTSFDGIEMATVDNWTVTHPMSINDFTRELEKDCFKDKEELIRAIKLHTIKTHKHYEVANSIVWNQYRSRVLFSEVLGLLNTWMQ